MMLTSKNPPKVRVPSIMNLTDAMAFPTGTIAKAPQGSFLLEIKRTSMGVSVNTIPKVDGVQMLDNLSLAFRKAVVNADGVDYLYARASNGKWAKSASAQLEYKMKENLASAGRR